METLLAVLATVAVIAAALWGVFWLLGLLMFEASPREAARVASSLTGAAIAVFVAVAGVAAVVSLIWSGVN